MAAIKFIKRTVALDGSNITEQLPASFFNNEASAHTFIIAGVRDGAAVAFSGSVSAVFHNANDADVSLTGSIVDGAAVVTLSNACYALSGRFTLTIDVNGATVYECNSRIKRRSSGTAYDPDDELSIAALSAEIAEMRTATAAANTATTNANTAATNANTARENMQGIIATTFSSSTAYAAGDYVWYNGTLYRFTANHAAGSWAGSDATAAVLGDDLSDLKIDLSDFGDDLSDFGDDLSELKSAINYTIGNETRQKGILTSDGTYAGTGTNFVSITKTYKPLKGDKFAYNGLGNGSAVACILYNNGTIVNYISGNYTIVPLIIEIPDNVDTIVFSSFASTGNYEDINFSVEKIGNHHFDPLIEIKNNHYLRPTGEYDGSSGFVSISRSYVVDGVTEFEYTGYSSSGTLSCMKVKNGSVISFIVGDYTNDPLIIKPDGSFDSVVFSSYARSNDYDDVIFDVKVSYSWDFNGMKNSIDTIRIAIESIGTVRETESALCRLDNMIETTMKNGSVMHIPYNSSGITSLKAHITGKNIHAVRYPTRTNGGVTFTVDELTGKIKLSGASGSSGAYAANGSSVVSDLTKLVYLPAGKYILSGCHDSNVQAYLIGSYIDGTSFLVRYDSGEGATYNLEKAANVTIQVVVLANKNVNGVELNLMLRLAGEDASYEPYKGNIVDVVFQDGTGQSLTVYGGDYDPYNGIITVTKDANGNDITPVAYTCDKIDSLFNTTPSFIWTNVGNSIIYYVSSSKSSALFNKKILNLGDSIAENRSDSISYAVQLANHEGAILSLDLAVGGSTISLTENQGTRGSILSQAEYAIESTPSANYDIVLIDGGTNDFGLNRNVGTIVGTAGRYVESDYAAEYDETTVLGALESIFSIIRNQYVGAIIVFVIRHKGPATGELWDAYLTGIRNVCEKWSIPILDIDRIGELNTRITVMKNAYTINQDGTHPNTAGIAKYYLPGLIDLLSFYFI